MLAEHLGEIAAFGNVDINDCVFGIASRINGVMVEISNGAIGHDDSRILGSKQLGLVLKVPNHRGHCADNGVSVLEGRIHRYLIEIVDVEWSERATPRPSVQHPLNISLVLLLIVRGCNEVISGLCRVTCTSTENHCVFEFGFTVSFLSVNSCSYRSRNKWNRSSFRKIRLNDLPSRALIRLHGKVGLRMILLEIRICHNAVLDATAHDHGVVDAIVGVVGGVVFDTVLGSNKRSGEAFERELNGLAVFEGGFGVNGLDDDVGCLDLGGFGSRGDLGLDLIREGKVDEADLGHVRRADFGKLALLEGEGQVHGARCGLDFHEFALDGLALLVNLVDQEGDVVEPGVLGRIGGLVACGARVGGGHVRIVVVAVTLSRDGGHFELGVVGNGCRVVERGSYLEGIVFVEVLGLGGSLFGVGLDRLLVSRRLRGCGVALFRGGLIVRGLCLVGRLAFVHRFFLGGRLAFAIRFILGGGLCLSSRLLLGCRLLLSGRTGFLGRGFLRSALLESGGSHLLLLESGKGVVRVGERRALKHHREGKQNGQRLDGCLPARAPLGCRAVELRIHVETPSVLSVISAPTWHWYIVTPFMHSSTYAKSLCVRILNYKHLFALFQLSQVDFLHNKERVSAG